MTTTNDEQEVRKLTRLGSHSFYALIPPRIIRALKWKKGQKLIVERRGEEVVIRDWRRSQ